MSETISRRRSTATALVALLLGAGLFFSPRLAERVYAQQPSSCTVNCKGGSCSGTGNCTCSCSFWTGMPTCSCSDPVEQT